MVPVDLNVRLSISFLQSPMCRLHSFWDIKCCRQFYALLVVRAAWYQRLHLTWQVWLPINHWRVTRC